MVFLLIKFISLSCLTFTKHNHNHFVLILLLTVAYCVDHSFHFFNIKKTKLWIPWCHFHMWFLPLCHLHSMLFPLPLLFPSCCLAQHLPPNMTASVVLTNTPLSCFFSLQGSNPPLITSFKLLSHTDTEV